MSWALESAARELAADMKQYGITIDQRSSVMLTRDVAVRLIYHHDTAYYRKIIKAEIERCKELKAAKLRARQISLL